MTYFVTHLAKNSLSGQLRRGIKKRKTFEVPFATDGDEDPRSAWPFFVPNSAATCARTTQKKWEKKKSEDKGDKRKRILQLKREKK